MCGELSVDPLVVNTGTRPHERAALRARMRAFRAAGLVRNTGGWAFFAALLGFIFFPFGAVGALMGLYVLTMLRGARRRYSGAGMALLAVGLGGWVFVRGGARALTWFETRQHAAQLALQKTASLDLQALLHAERVYKAAHSIYGRFGAIAYKPTYGCYVIYLDREQYLGGHCEAARNVADAPADVPAHVSGDTFRAVAVMDLDGDPELDIWTMTHQGVLVHERDDLRATP